MDMKKVDPDLSVPKDAHQIALELLKQIITLAAGVLALSATFIEKFGSASIWLLIVLALAWVSLIVSVLMGLEAISAIVKSRLSSDYDWSEGTGRSLASASKYAFVVGIALFAGFALLSLAAERHTGTPTTSTLPALP
jgi:hypothetical protein